MTIDDIFKLELSHDDVIVVRVPVPGEQIERNIRHALRQEPSFANTTVLVLGPDTSIEHLSPDVMKALGWFRR